MNRKVAANQEKNIRRVRWMIWLYFWLLIIEGALRKWALPQLSNPLLIVRDPVVLLAFYFAIKGRVFPRNIWVYVLGGIATLCCAASFLVLWPYIAPQRIALVTGYGFRSNFLHLPLIFLMARVLTAEDVKRFGWWTLAVLIPLALLMVAQFRASPDAFLNRTAGGEGEMMMAALGKVRTAATFSFVVGVVSYFALACAFLIWAALRRDVYKTWLVLAAACALAVGIAVSGSRSVVAACVIVVASLLLVLFLKPSAVNRFGQTLLAVVLLGVIVTRIPVFREGLNVLTTRFSEAAEATEKSLGAGAVDRIFGDIGEGLYAMTKAPILGYGVGLGTNAGAKFLGFNVFLLSEGEWSRIFLESGPMLGGAYLLWRLALSGYVGLLCIRSVRLGNLLPLLLFSAAILALTNGQFGQPTVLGFAVFVTGLALAARKLDDAAEASLSDAIPAEARGQLRPVRGRSAYAERLHGSSAPDNHSNGSADR